MDAYSDIINSETETDSESVDLTSVESQESSNEGRGAYYHVQQFDNMGKTMQSDRRKRPEEYIYKKSDPVKVKLKKAMKRQRNLQ